MLLRAPYCQIVVRALLCTCKRWLQFSVMPAKANGKSRRPQGLFPNWLAGTDAPLVQSAKQPRLDRHDAASKVMRPKGYGESSWSRVGKRTDSEAHPVDMPSTREGHSGSPSFLPVSPAIQPINNFNGAAAPAPRTSHILQYVLVRGSIDKLRLGPHVRCPRRRTELGLAGRPPVVGPFACRVTPRKTTAGWRGWCSDPMSPASRCAGTIGSKRGLRATRTRRAVRTQLRLAQTGRHLLSGRTRTHLGLIRNATCAIQPPSGTVGATSQTSADSLWYHSNPRQIAPYSRLPAW